MNSKNHNDVNIKFINDKHIYTPKDGGLWTLAKLHFQASASFLLPGAFHGNIHFGLPCVAAACLDVLPVNDVLYQLLAPHFRFTLRINNEALRVQKAQDRTKPYAPFPMIGSEFIASIANDIQEQLIKSGFRAPHWSLKDNDLPFNQYGLNYYEIVKQFVVKVMPFISQESLSNYSSSVAQYLPEFEKINPIDSLATLIWQVSFLHSADHYSMEHIMSSDCYTFLGMQLPSPSESRVKVETLQSTVIRMACNAESRYRANVFASTFVKGHKNPLWSNTMDNISYDFKIPELKLIVNEFQNELIMTEKKLKSMNINICPLDNTFQSICW